MWILAIDSSTGSGSVALLNGGRLTAMRVLDAQRRTARTLAPAIAELFAEQGLAPSDLGLVTTTVGPGSFTGLRIGVTMAKTLAYATGAALVGVSTLEALAHSLPASQQHPPRTPVEAILNAHRGELFVGKFEVVSEPTDQHEASLPCLRRLSPDRLLPADLWRSGVAPGSVVIGPEVLRYINSGPDARVGMYAVAAQVRADVVGKLAWRDYQAGRRVEPFTLMPVYLRPSYAEEKRSVNGGATAAGGRNFDANDRTSL